MQTTNELAAQISRARHEIRLCSPLQSADIAELNAQIKVLEAELNAQVKVLEDERDNQLAPAKTAETKSQPTGRRDWHEKSKGDARITGGYLRVPTAITRANNLNPTDKAVALAIRQATNFGPWNHDLHVDLTHAELVDRAGVGSISTVQRAVARLKAGGYL